MKSPKIIYGGRFEGDFLEIARELENKGHKVYDKAVDGERFIVLGGKSENPLCLKGHRTLIFHTAQWGNKWRGFFFDILKHYYDKVVDVSNCKSAGEAVAIIERELG